MKSIPRMKTYFLAFGSLKEIWHGHLGYITIHGGSRGTCSAVRALWRNCESSSMILVGSKVWSHSLHYARLVGTAYKRQNRGVMLVRLANKCICLSYI